MNHPEYNGYMPAFLIMALVGVGTDAGTKNCVDAGPRVLRKLRNRYGRKLDGGKHLRGIGGKYTGWSDYA